MEVSLRTIALEIGILKALSGELLRMPAETMHIAREQREFSDIDIRPPHPTCKDPRKSPRGYLDAFIISVS